MEDLAHSELSWNAPLLVVPKKPGTFQRLMNKVLTGLNGLRAFVYLDDIIIYAKDLKDNSQKLSETFNRLRQYNLKTQPLKCEFLKKEDTYLGHRISDEEV